MKKIRHYYTLNEMYPDGFDATSVQEEINEVCQSKQTLDTKFSQVINILSDSYGKWYIGYIDTFNVTDAQLEELKEEFIKHFCVIYNFTEKKYLTLLGLYESQESNLMKQLNSVESITGSRRVNDTPQDAGEGHDNFEDDDHTNLWEGNESTRTTNTDPNTVMERLDQIQRLYSNLIRDWCNEFAKLFIAPHRELNVEEDNDD